MLSPDELQEMRAEAVLKYRRDQFALRVDAEERGELVGMIVSAQRFLKLPPTPRDELRAMSFERLRELVVKLVPPTATDEPPK